MIKKAENVLIALEAFKTQGFDRIHIPGGTSKDEKHYSGVFVYYHDTQEKEIYFLGVPYNSNFYKSIEANGHTKKLGETPIQTVIRETQEETGLLIEEDGLRMIDSYSIPSRTGSDQKHHKYFYLTSNFRGQLFDFQGKPNPIDNETGSPIWIPLPIFAKVLFGRNEKGFVFGHRKSLDRALSFLSSDKEMYFIIEKAGLLPAW